MILPIDNSLDLTIRILTYILAVITWFLLPFTIRICLLVVAIFSLYHYRNYHLPFARAHGHLY